MNIDPSIRKLLDNETTIHEAQIRALFQSLDRKFGLRGASVPIRFGYDEALLGSYTPASAHERESFYFSLLFIGYAVKKPLSKEDRLDLYKHEYAHYMQYNMKIPAQYNWQSGKHGSAWKYCCSLTGAAPTPYYKAGEALMKHDYEKKLRSPIHDRTVTVRDTYRRKQQHENTRNSIVRYEIGEDVSHPKFGTGNIEHVEQLPGSVRLHIRFGEELKVIDQKWLLRSKYK